VSCHIQMYMSKICYTYLFTCSLTHSLTHSLNHSLTHSVKQSPSWEARRFSASQEIPPHLMEHDSSLPCLHVPLNCPYPEPDQSTPHSPHHFSSSRSILIQRVTHFSFTLKHIFFVIYWRFKTVTFQTKAIKLSLMTKLKAD